MRITWLSSFLKRDIFFEDRGIPKMDLYREFFLSYPEVLDDIRNFVTMGNRYSPSKCDRELYFNEGKRAVFDYILHNIEQGESRIDKEAKKEGNKQ